MNRKGDWKKLVNKVGPKINNTHFTQKQKAENISKDTTKLVVFRNSWLKIVPSNLNREWKRSKNRD